MDVPECLSVRPEFSLQGLEGHERPATQERERNLDLLLKLRVGLQA